MNSLLLVSESAKRGRVDFADNLRGLAAAAVVFSHYFGLFWYRPEVIGSILGIEPLPTQSTAVYRVATKIVALSPIDTGPLGVAVFFLISGFVIPFSVERLNRKGFLFSRIMRIFPTYFAGFSIGVVAIFLTGKLFGSPFPYSFREIAVHSIPGLREVMNTREIDNVVWTLDVELKFYLLWLFFGSQKISIKSVLYIGLIILFSFIFTGYLIEIITHDNFFFHIVSIIRNSTHFLFYFLIGTLFFLHYSKRISGLLLILGSLIFLALFTLIWYLIPYATPFPVVANYVLALMLFSCVYICPQFLNCFDKILSPLSRISYPLYASHALLGYSIMATGFYIGYPKAGLMAAILLALAVATILHYLVEKPTQTFGRFMGKRFRNSTLNSNSG